MEPLTLPEPPPTVEIPTPPPVIFDDPELNAGMLTQVQREICVLLGIDPANAGVAMSNRLYSLRCAYCGWLMMDRHMLASWDRDRLDARLCSRCYEERGL